MYVIPMEKRRPYSYYSSVRDKLLYHKILGLTTVRKLFTALSQVVPGLLILCIGYIDSIPFLLTTWFIAVIFITASYAGAMANIIDIAPNYGHSGAVLAFCQTIHMSASFLSPLTVGFLVTQEDSIDQWRIVFEVSGIIAMVTYMFYQWFGTAQIQSWNIQQPIRNQLQETEKMFSKENGATQLITKAK
ncbi:uncharacterized protein Dvir_GJ26706, isoform B [Drosophila virilis]|uniref:Uncharacterized protein, isoform B n=1 Tax=Drosophila virilis TaxID=7244 RepID=A0A0Q9WAU0_DROVI|nr:probable small intestine urate exporter isoform X2 [Drosophila virilis]KRF78175.1 uncharacterized protein Dvir_GJ26706, isoform B [Drosophila virilis]